MFISETVHINASPERLWELMTEVEQIKRWTPSLVSEDPLSPDPAKVGALSIMKIKEGSKIVEYESELAAFQPTNHLGIILRGGNLGDGPMHVDYFMSPGENCTIVTYEARWEPHGLMLKLMTPLLTKMSQRNAREAMHQLKIVAEQGVHTHIAP